MTFLEASDKVCGELPRGWQIEIVLERESGDIQLTNPDGDVVEFPATYESFEQTLLDALEYAQEQHREEAVIPAPGPASCEPGV